MCLFLGILGFVVKNTQSFLDQQLSSHSQDTATALGLCLSQTMKNNDVVTASRIVDAIWDRGYYQSIEIQTTNGAPLVERHMEIKVYKVPHWFIEMLHLHTAKKEALIMDGWRKVGKVIIKSNPGFAYEQIWLTFINSLEWLLVTCVIASFFGGILLYIILRPLRAITAQAAAICNQQFITQEKLPWTIDLRKVVEAMNNMSRRLRTLFEEQAKASEQLREQAYKDPVTHLGNRRFFDLQLDHLLKEEASQAAGILLLIELEAFKEYNDIFGYAQGDKLLQNAAKAIEDSANVYHNAIVTHAKGASFFVILPDKTRESGESLAKAIGQSFDTFFEKELSRKKEVGHVGVCAFKFGDDKKEIFSRVDMALRAAQAQGPNQWFYIEGGQKQTVHGAKEWGAIFAEVIRDNKIVLHFQETRLLSRPNEKIYETLLRLKLSEQEIIPAGTFMPMAEQLNQMIVLDKLVIENVALAIERGKTDAVFTVNLSPNVLEDEPFKKWLLERTKALGKKANRLMIEFPEHAVIRRIDKARDFFLKFSALGGKTSIDHYGKNFNSFSYLYNLKLNILKIDGGFIRNIQESQENQFFVRSLVDIAHSLDILVIAEAVETEAEYNALQQLKVDGVQGYYIGKPTYIDI
jgi:diguanylate cyclase (GGDEF)-like protein